MSLRSRLQSRLLAAALSPPVQAGISTARRMRSRLSGEHPRISVNLRLDDPYSLLLVRRLAAINAAYKVTLDIHLVDEHIPDQFVPDRERLDAYSRRDVAFLANELGEDFDPARENKDARLGMQCLVADLLTQSDGELDFAQLAELFEAYWNGGGESLAESLSRVKALGLERTRQFVNRCNQQLIENGHYNPATLHYDGEWFWSLDRLHYLLAKLDTHGLAKKGGSAERVSLKGIRDRINPEPDARSGYGGVHTIEVFFSFRSPYSYLAVEQLCRLQESCELNVRLRPVLPMVRRGLAVPTSKRLYIVKDTYREAQRLGISFGKITDPLNAAERLIALFYVAAESGKEQLFTRLALRAAWSEGKDLTDNAELQALSRAAGMTTSMFRQSEHLEDALEKAARNRKELNSLGLWGVQSFKVGEEATWGRDRLGGFLAKHFTNKPES